MIWVIFWNIRKIYFFFFHIQNIKSNYYIVFLKIFPIIFFWWKIYFFLLLFIYKRLNFCDYLSMFFYFCMVKCYVTAYWKHLSFFIDRTYCCFFLFYPIRIIYIWVTRIRILTFIITWMIIIQDKLTTFYRFQIILISILNRINKFFCNFICFIINYDFYATTFWMHYMLFVFTFGRNKVV